jgi:hypothetical protein
MSTNIFFELKKNNTHKIFINNGIIPDDNYYNNQFLKQINFINIINIFDKKQIFKLNDSNKININKNNYILCNSLFDSDLKILNELNSRKFMLKYIINYYDMLIITKILFKNENISFRLYYDYYAFIEYEKYILEKNIQLFNHDRIMNKINKIIKLNEIFENIDNDQLNIKKNNILKNLQYIDNIIRLNSKNITDYMFLSVYLIANIDIESMSITNLQEEQEQLQISIDSNKYNVFLYDFNIDINISKYYIEYASNKKYYHNNKGYIGQLARIFIARDTSLNNNTIVMIRDAHATTPNYGDLLLLEKFNKCDDKKYLIGYNTKYNMSRHFNGNAMRHSKGILMGYVNFKIKIKKTNDELILNNETWERTYGLLFSFKNGKSNYENEIVKYSENKNMIRHNIDKFDASDISQDEFINIIKYQYETETFDSNKELHMVYDDIYVNPIDTTINLFNNIKLKYNINIDDEKFKFFIKMLFVMYFFELMSNEKNNRPFDNFLKYIIIKKYELNKVIQLKSLELDSILKNIKSYAIDDECIQNLNKFYEFYEKYNDLNNNTIDMKKDIINQIKSLSLNVNIKKYSIEIHLLPYIYMYILKQNIVDRNSLFLKLIKFLPDNKHIDKIINIMIFRLFGFYTKNNFFYTDIHMYVFENEDKLLKLFQKFYIQFFLLLFNTIVNENDSTININMPKIKNNIDNIFNAIEDNNSTAFVHHLLNSSLKQNSMDAFYRIQLQCDENCIFNEIAEKNKIYLQINKLLNKLLNNNDKMDENGKFDEQLKETFILLKKIGNFEQNNNNLFDTDTLLIKLKPHIFKYKLKDMIHLYKSQCYVPPNFMTYGVDEYLFAKIFMSDEGKMYNSFNVNKNNNELYVCEGKQIYWNHIIGGFNSTSCNKSKIRIDIPFLNTIDSIIALLMTIETINNNDNISDDYKYMHVFIKMVKEQTKLIYKKNNNKYIINTYISSFIYINKCKKILYALILNADINTLHILSHDINYKIYRLLFYYMIAMPLLHNELLTLSVSPSEDYNMTYASFDIDGAMKFYMSVDEIQFINDEIICNEYIDYNNNANKYISLENNIQLRKYIETYNLKCNSRNIKAQYLFDLFNNKEFNGELNDDIIKSYDELKPSNNFFENLVIYVKKIYKNEDDIKNL